MKIRKELVKGCTSFMILKVIAEGDTYGYQITQSIALKSDNIFNLNEGTLYPILHAMEKDGLIESYSLESEHGRMRKYYHITALGKTKLASQIEEWSAFSSAVNSVLS